MLPPGTQVKADPGRLSAQPRHHHQRPSAGLGLQRQRGAGQRFHHRQRPARPGHCRAEGEGGQRRIRAQPALTTKGKVLAWGDNSCRAARRRHTTSSDTPVRVRLPRAPGRPRSRPASAQPGPDQQGQGAGLGRQHDGQLGNGSTRNSDAPVRTRLPRRTRVRGLFAGCFHSLALTSKHKLLAGDPTAPGSSATARTPTGIARSGPSFVKGTRVTAISAGCFHSLARTSKGHVLAWGGNNSGELGIGRTSSKSDHPRRVKLPAGLSAVAIGSGPDALFSLAIVRKAKPWHCLRPPGRGAHDAETAWFAAAGQPSRMHPAPGGWRGRAGTARRLPAAGAVAAASGGSVRAGLLPAEPSAPGEQRVRAARRRDHHQQLAPGPGTAPGGLAAVAIGGGPAADFSLAVVRRT